MLDILLKAGIGDAWAVCFEYAPKKVIEENINEWNYFLHHKYNIGNGRYSDDLQMHIAVAETLLAGPPYTELSFIENFVKAFKRDPREGYAGRFYQFLQDVKDAKDFADNIKPESEKSGGAMRSACIGIIANMDDVLKVSECQARTTHNTPRGIAAAQASTLMLHYFLYNKGPKSDLPDFLNQYIPIEDWANLPVKKIGHLGVDSVRAALRAIISENSLQQILKSVVSCGGDTDTAATIALGAASCSKEIDQTLPESLLSGFEKGPYGIDYIRSLDEKLTQFALEQGAQI